MAAYNKFNSFVENMPEKVYNLGSDVLKIALTNSAPVATNTVLANITQIANGNGYTTGGATVTVSASSQTSGTYKLVGSAANPTWTASGSMGPFRYVVLYDDTATNDELIGWWDYGSAITLASGDTFTVVFDGTNGILQIA
jgi:hypothetical protein